MKSNSSAMPILTSKNTIEPASQVYINDAEYLNDKLCQDKLSLIHSGLSREVAEKLGSRSLKQSLTPQRTKESSRSQNDDAIQLCQQVQETLRSPEFRTALRRLFLNLGKQESEFDFDQLDWLSHVSVSPVDSIVQDYYLLGECVAADVEEDADWIEHDDGELELQVVADNSNDRESLYLSLQQKVIEKLHQWEYPIHSGHTDHSSILLICIRQEPSTIAGFLDKQKIATVRDPDNSVSDTEDDDDDAVDPQNLFVPDRGFDESSGSTEGDENVGDRSMDDAEEDDSARPSATPSAPADSSRQPHDSSRSAAADASAGSPTQHSRDRSQDSTSTGKQPTEEPPHGHGEPGQSDSTPPSTTATGEPSKTQTPAGQSTGKPASKTQTPAGQSTGKPASKNTQRQGSESPDNSNSFSQTNRTTSPNSAQSQKGKADRDGKKSQRTQRSPKIFSDAKLLKSLDDAFNQPGSVNIDPGYHGSPEKPSNSYQKIRDQQIQKDRCESGGASPDSYTAPRLVWKSKDPETRQTLLERYGGRCQICDFTFPKRNGDPYFEAAYLISYTKGAWLDFPGNTLCLCANCSAQFKHGAREVVNLREQIQNPKLLDNGKPAIDIQLCGQPKQIVFDPKHMVDLQSLLGAISS